MPIRKNKHLCIVITQPSNLMHILLSPSGGNTPQSLGNPPQRKRDPYHPYEGRRIRHLTFSNLQTQWNYPPLSLEFFNEHDGPFQYYCQHTKKNNCEYKHKMIFQPPYFFDVCGIATKRMIMHSSVGLSLACILKTIYNSWIH